MHYRGPARRRATAPAKTYIADEKEVDMGVIPLSDASRRPSRFPVMTASIITVNALVFLLELIRGETFVTTWSVSPPTSSPAVT
jgi:hypothetical protein